jgi:hypothetical protein
VIPEIDIWRAANLMLKRYGDKALEESAARADELAAQDDYNGEAVWRRITDAVGQLASRGKRIRTVGSAMRLDRRQRCRGVTPPDPGGERRLLGPPLDNSIGMARPATARMTGAPVDRFQLGRTHETVAYLSSAELNVRIRSPPPRSLARSRFLSAGCEDASGIVGMERSPHMELDKV